MINSFTKIHESTNGKPVVFTFGRFNPPTRGHELVVNKVMDIARIYRADAKIYTSQSSGDKKNPLSWSDKVYFLRNFFPKVDVPKESGIKTVFDIALNLYKQGYTA